MDIYILCHKCQHALAKRNAEKIDSRIKFKVADAQILTPIADNQFDIVYATYICWLEDLYQAARAWHRVLKPGRRLLLSVNHPVVECLKETNYGLTVTRDYFDNSPEYSNFTGTPIADEYGGWDGNLPIVEFIHPLADVINAIAEAGLCISRWWRREHRMSNPRCYPNCPNMWLGWQRKKILNS